MLSKYISWTYLEENTNKFRCFTILFAIAYIVLYKFIITSAKTPFAFNILTVLVGISLFSVVQQMFISFFVTWGFLLFESIEINSITFFIIQWASFFTVSYVISYLIKIHIREYRNTENFIKTLARTIESRDNYTACHSMNVANYALAIAEKLNYSKKECNSIFMGALLHDIGKIGISDSILNKNTRLTEEEYMCIQQHPNIGYNMLKVNQPFQDKKILDIILYHHERYDGKGYPNHLKGNEIPKHAAIVAVADAFDAMVSKRVYHEEYDLNYALNEVRMNAGSQFDPEIAKIFIEYISNNLHTIRENSKRNPLRLYGKRKIVT